jgi:hypothetical protein
MVLHARVGFWSWLLFSAFLVGTAGACSTSAGEGQVGVSDAMVLFPPDAQSQPGDASACRPGDVATYRPAPYRLAAAAHKGVCDAMQIADFFRECLGPQKTSAQCSAFMSDKTTGACAACIVTSETADHYGPVIDHSGFVTANVAGCIELTDPSGVSCAKSVQALSGCELAACEANCPVHDAPSRSAYDACAKQADQAGCLYYAKAASCSAAEEDAGQAAICLLPMFQNFYDAVVPLFCGSPPSGADAGLTFDAADGDARAVDGSTDSGPGPRDGSSDALGDVATDAQLDATKD